MVPGEWSSCRTADDPHDHWLLQRSRWGLSSFDTLLNRSPVPSRCPIQALAWAGIFVGHRTQARKHQVPRLRSGCRLECGGGSPRLRTSRKLLPAVFIGGRVGEAKVCYIGGCDGGDGNERVGSLGVVAVVSGVLSITEVRAADGTAVGVDPRLF